MRKRPPDVAVVRTGAGDFARGWLRRGERWLRPGAARGTLKGTRSTHFFFPEGGYLERRWERLASVCAKLGLLKGRGNTLREMGVERGEPNGSLGR